MYENIGRWTPTCPICVPSTPTDSGLHGDASWGRSAMRRAERHSRASPCPSRKRGRVYCVFAQVRRVNSSTDHGRHASGCPEQSRVQVRRLSRHESTSPLRESPSQCGLHAVALCLPTAFRIRQPVPYSCTISKSSATRSVQPMNPYALPSPPTRVASSPDPPAATPEASLFRALRFERQCQRVEYAVGRNLFFRWLPSSAVCASFEEIVRQLFMWQKRTWIG